MEPQLLPRFSRLSLDSSTSLFQLGQSQLPNSLPFYEHLCFKPAFRLKSLLFLSFFVFWALFPKPEGTIRQCSNAENHHPSATHFVTSTLCALLASSVIIHGSVWGAGERAPNCPRAFFKCGLLPFTTKRALELSLVVSRRASWHTTWNEQGVKRVPHPRLYSQPEVTGTLTLAKHSSNGDLLTARFNLPDSQDNTPLWIISSCFFLVVFEARHPPLHYWHR